MGVFTKKTCRSYGALYLGLLVLQTFRSYGASFKILKSHLKKSIKREPLLTIHFLFHPIIRLLVISNRLMCNNPHSV